MRKSILILSIAAIVGAEYFLLRKSMAQLKHDINNILPESEKYRMDDVLNRMSRQELLDTHQLIYSTRVLKRKITDPALIQRLNLISTKYNIFT